MSREPKFLLVHMRKDPEVCLPEYAQFIKHTGLPEHQLDAVNLYATPNWDVSKLKEYRAFLVGGLSDDPSDRIEVTVEIYPFIETLRALLNEAIRIKVPGMLSCGGFMLASELLGGRLTLDEEYREMGIVTVSKTENASSDPLLGPMPGSFAIVSGHLKSTIALPSDATLLLSSGNCPIHAFKLNDSPIYAFQGHPEMTKAELKIRVLPYKEKYFKSEKDYLDFISSEGDTSAINGVLKRFVELVNVGVFDLDD